MTKSKTNYIVFQEASLSQKLGDRDEIEIKEEKIKIYPKLAGSDPETSVAIGNMLVLAKYGIIDLSTPMFALTLDLLDMKRRALFATSPHTNEITKMGFQMPKPEDVISTF